MPDFLILQPFKEHIYYQRYLFFICRNVKAYEWIRRPNKPDHWSWIERVADAFYVHFDLVPIIKREIEEAGFTWQMAIEEGQKSSVSSSPESQNMEPAG